MYEVRAATTVDAHEVQNIFSMCIANADWLPEQARTSLDFAHSSVGEVVHVAASRDGEVLGFVSVQTTDSFVHHLYVRPGVRSRGVGRLLLSSLEPWLTTPWRLKCVRANRRALTFYIGLGWREVASGESADGPYAVLEWPSPNTAVNADAPTAARPLP